METDGGGWTVFQRRQDGSVDFYRNWTDYENGFGNLTGEHWLGLSQIYRITQQGSNTLRVDLEDFDGNSRYAKYSTFNIGNSSTQYTLTVSGYSGTAGNCLTYPYNAVIYHNGMKFSTKDRDNDINNDDNCAIQFKGAWWYNGCHCANLNGLYLSGPHSSYADGINWTSWKGVYYSLKFTEMKVRRNY